MAGAYSKGALMKEFVLANVVNCPVCGAPVKLRKNASKDFQVACTRCEARTGWGKKTEVVITWYNMVIQHWRNAGVLK